MYVYVLVADLDLEPGYRNRIRICIRNTDLDPVLEIVSYFCQLELFLQKFTFSPFLTFKIGKLLKEVFVRQHLM